MEKDVHYDIPHENEAINIGGYGAAFRITSPRAVDPTALRSVTGEIVKEIAEACMRKGAKAIGHVKLYLKAQSGYIRADTVGMKYGVHVDGNIARPERVANLVVNSSDSCLEREMRVVVLPLPRKPAIWTTLMLKPS